MVTATMKLKYALWKKRQHIKNQKHHFADKDLDSQSCDFSISQAQMWELDHKEGWALKNWCFELRSWRRLLRVPWTARRSKQSILKEINPEYSLKGLMLKLQDFGHLIRGANSLENWCWERLRAGGEGGNRRWDGWMALMTQWTWVWTSSRR